MNHLPRWLAGILGLAILALVIGGATFYRSQRSDTQRQAETNLRIIAQAKATSIAEWRANQIAEAVELASDRHFVQQVSRWFEAPVTNSQDDISEHLRNLQAHYHYSDVILLDAVGKQRMTLSGLAQPLTTNTISAIRAATESRRPMLANLETDGASLYLDTVVPLSLKGSASLGLPIGSVLLRNDPKKFLFPLIRSWPQPSSTAETLMVMRDGDSALFLNELRFRTNTVLKLRLPLSETNVPAVRAALGGEGVMKGTDYRGASVISAFSSVSGSPWAIVAKVDTEEAYAAGRVRAVLIASLVATWILLVGVGVLLVWQRNAKVYYRAMHKAEALRFQLEERYRITLMSIGDAVVATDTSGRIEVLNPVAETLTGWKQDDACGKKLEEVFQIISEATGEPIENPVRQVMREGKVVGLANHTSLISRDNIVRPIADAAAPIRDSGGVVSGMVLVFRDQTQERRAQRDLADSKARLDFALKAAQIGTWHWDIDTNKRYFDEQTCLILGVDPVRFSGTESEFFNHVHPGDLEMLKAAFHRTIQDDVPYELDYRIIWFDGSVHTVASRGRLKRNDLGQVQGVGGVLWDVTDRIKIAAERERSELAVRQSQAELEAIYDGTPIMMCLVNRNGQIERMNRAMAEFSHSSRLLDTPISPGDLLACRNSLRQGCGHGPDCSTCTLRSALLGTLETGSAVRQLEMSLTLANDDVKRDVRLSASTALVRLGEEPKVLVCLEDVTHSRFLEAQLLQAQKMEAIGQLAGGVAHDFNNILAATLLHLQLLQQDMVADSPLAVSLKELEHEAQRAASLTRQLLLFSRRQVVRVQQINLNEVVHGLMDMLARLLGENIVIKTEFSPEPAILEADHGMIEQVVMNLCVNSRDAMPQGGNLALRTGTLKITDPGSRRHPGARAGHFVCLAVSDTGSGMDEATLKHIFEPFFTTKQPGKGTGLGLATVYGIVKQHGGWIEVKSTLGEGTTFEILFPATEIRKVEPVAADPGRLQGGNETILLVEDEHAVRRLVHRTLEKLGYKVLEASNGVEAIRVWKAYGGRVDLLFTDMVMPEGLTGLDLGERLRLYQPDLKIVISSGYSAELLKQGDQVPTNTRFLGKPYTPQVLANTIRDCLEGVA